MLTKEEFTCLARKYMDTVFRISCVFHGRNMHPWKIIWKLCRCRLSPASESDVETFADAALGDKSISTNHAERTNSSGEVLDDPDSQRVAVDSVTANELLSGNVQNVDATVEVGGYTFDFEQLVVDKNGNGMLSYTISNPDNITLESFFPFVLNHIVWLPLGIIWAFSLQRLKSVYR